MVGDWGMDTCFHIQEPVLYSFTEVQRWSSSENIPDVLSVYEHQF